jgi:hypothetical protein
MTDCEGGLFSVLAVAIVAKAFGIVWAIIARSRIPADDRLDENGLPFLAATA